MGNWLADDVEGLAAPVEIGFVSGGSNLTCRVTDAAGATYALRRPPTGGVLSTARDVSREGRFVSALAPTAVPVPQAVAYCAGHAGVGAGWRVPAQASGIVHGDYRTGDVAFGADGAVRAVFDWEVVTAGDPMAGLEWLASTWQDPGEQLPPTTPKRDKARLRMGIAVLCWADA